MAQQISQRLELDQRPRRAYIIENGGKFCPLFFKVELAYDAYEEYEVIGFEIYSTREAAVSNERARQVPYCVSEDSWDNLPKDAQEEIEREIFRQDCVRRDARIRLHLDHA